MSSDEEKGQDKGGAGDVHPDALAKKKWLFEGVKVPETLSDEDVSVARAQVRRSGSLFWVGPHGIVSNHTDMDPTDTVYIGDTDGNDRLGRIDSDTTDPIITPDPI